MSTKLKLTHFLKVFSVFAVMFSIGYFSADYLIFSDGPQQSTSLNSILINAKMGKSLSFVNVQLEPTEIPEGPNEVAEISGFITLMKSTNNTVTYQWILPEGVEIVEGDKEGRLESVTVENPIQIKIKVSGYTKSEKKLITLSASTLIGETAFSNVAILSSRPEDSHEYIAKQRYDHERATEKMQRLDLSSESAEDLRSEEKIQK